MTHRRLSLILSCFIILTGCAKDGKVSANQWALEQECYYEDIESACKSIEDLFALYLVEAIIDDDFNTEIDLICIQLKASQLQYWESLENLKPGTHSFASKCLETSITDIYDETLDFLQTEVIESKDTEALLQSYLVWQDSTATHMATYHVAYSLISEQEEKHG